MCSAWAHEHITMPFNCAVADGRLTLTPSNETSYAIVGARDAHTTSSCARGQRSVCDTVVMYRFNVACEGGDVAWTDIASGLSNPASHADWMSGFAPVAEVGARLSHVAQATQSVRLTRVAMNTQARTRETTIAVIDPEAMRTAGTRMQAWDTVLQPTYGQDDWVTVVHTGSADHTEAVGNLNAAGEAEAAPVSGVADAASAPEVDAGAKSALWPIVLGAFSLAAIVALLLKLMPVLQTRALRTARARLRRRSVTIANACSTVSALLEQTDHAVAQLKGAGPLREVLSCEVQAVRERAQQTELAAGNGELSADRAALQFRTMVRELDRIRRIVDSAIASLKKSNQTQAQLPQTAFEAYEVLGVNAHVSAGVLKKIVDALRMSWHPDHSHDDADRELREQRIRQINIAWDLINGERKAA